jgi:hypothetical protein
MGWNRLARLGIAVAAGVVALGGARANECSPNLAQNTPTPTLSWDQSSQAGTVGYRVYWKRDEDSSWRGSKDFPAYPGGVGSTPVWPGITVPVAVQKIIPNTEQYDLIDFMVVAYSSTNKESAPSSILRICMPAIWTSGPYW